MKSINANGTDPAQAYGAVITGRMIGAPEKKTVMETVPYMNGFYDFSALGGGPYYTQREIEYTIAIHDYDEAALFRKYEGLTSWLNGINGSTLNDEVYPSDRFTNATTTKIKVSDMRPNIISVTATIVCDPDMSS